MNRSPAWMLIALAGCAAPDMPLPRFTPAGELLRPESYGDWVLAGASLGLGYSEGSRREPPGDFHNVYTQPRAVAQYAATGAFPEGTVFVLALHEPKQRESIDKQGYFEGDLVALEASVKDRSRFPEGWAYFDFGKGGRKESARALPPSSCNACHAEHGADDNVFVQFYPRLRPILEARKAARAADPDSSNTNPRRVP